MKSLLIYIALILGSCSTKLAKNIPPGIHIAISSKKEINQKDDVIVELKFLNNTKSTHRLLDKFEPAFIFLSIKFIDKNNGKVYSPIPGGKADFPSSEVFTYIEIPPNRSHKTKINISKILKEYQFTLPSGIYKTMISYHNQYGQKCIQGTYNSNEIDINILE